MSDPALNSSDLDKAVVEMLGPVGQEGTDGMPAMYGPPEGSLPGHHNAEDLWKTFGGSS